LIKPSSQPLGFLNILNPALKPLCYTAFALIASNSSAQSSQSEADRAAALAAELASARPIALGQSYWLEELTWMEIRDMVAGGTTTIIIPTGGIEENGPYLATGKHNVILEGTCPAIAKNLGNALCAPIVKFVPEGNIEPPTGAMRYPGSISLSAATYEALLTDIASSLRQSGFTDIVMIGDSGGNQRGMANVATALNKKWAGTDTQIHFVREFYDPGWVETEQFTEHTLGVKENGNDGYHDDIWVTTMMMVTNPDLVRFEQRVEAGLASINGVAITPLADAVKLGSDMMEFRAGFTADAIRSAIAVKGQ
jgi:creatinine amidohydrolase/Fe(II)-dependent formamide hydrolase-like protein